jgi:hypothetical protein
MGNAVVKRSDTVLLPMEYVNIPYCVIRTSNDIDKDHMSCTTLHIKMENYRSFNCIDYREGGFRWIKNHATKRDSGWRVYLQANSEDRHVCGWRQIEKFWPLELDGQEEKIAEWRAELVEKLEKLELERQTNQQSQDLSESESN